MGALVQSQTAGDASAAATVTATFGANVTAGNLIHVFILYRDGGEGTSHSVSDNLGNTYTLIENVNRVNRRMAHYYAANIAGGACSVTLTTPNNNQFRSLAAVEISGLDTASPLDVYSSNVQDPAGTGTDAVVSGSATATAAGYLSACGIQVEDIGYGAPPNAGTGFTNDGAVLPPVGVNQGRLEHASVSAGSQQATFTSTFSGGGAHTSMMAIFKDATGGGGPVVVEESDFGSRRNRPGRGPYSLGRYFRQRIDAFNELIGSLFSDAISESETASESVSATVIHATTVTESASAAETLSALLAAAADIAETGSATFTPTGSLAALASISESGSASDSVSATAGVFSGVIAETASAADSVSSVLAAVAALSESGTASDSVSALGSFVAALAESVTVSDSVSWGGAVYSVDVAEAASATNTLSAAVNALAAFAEAGNATDAVSALAILQAALAESQSALDALSAQGVYGVSVAETGAATFTVTIDAGMVPGAPTRTVTVRAGDRTITVRYRNRTVTVH